MDGPESNERTPGEMTPAQRPAEDVVVGHTDADNVKIELLGLGQRLKALVDRYEKKPGVIDMDFSDTTVGRTVNVEGTIAEVYRVMKERVFTDDSPLRVDADLWGAFREQQDEFLEFYKHALNAMEVHQEIFRYHRLMMDEARQRPRHGDLEGIRQDNRAYIAQRDECIMAISNFSGKFSAMLIALRS
jgi:hypothetical protein